MTNIEIFKIYTLVFQLVPKSFHILLYYLLINRTFRGGYFESSRELFRQTNKEALSQTIIIKYINDLILKYRYNFIFLIFCR